MDNYIKENTSENYIIKDNSKAFKMETQTTVKSLH